MLTYGWTCDYSALIWRLSIKVFYFHPLEVNPQWFRFLFIEILIIWIFNQIDAGNLKILVIVFVLKVKNRWYVAEQEICASRAHRVHNYNLW